MGRKKCFGPGGMFMEIFSYGPCDGNTVISTRSPTNFVKKDQTPFRKIVQKEIDEKLKEGYVEIAEDKVSFLEIEFKIDGFGTEQDLDKRHRLEERMDELLGWTGLGNTDGGSSGSGTMEVGCVVVDFDIAKKVIEQDLKNTEFADYTRIFKMNE